MTDIVSRYGKDPVVTYNKMSVANQILWALSVALPKVSIAAWFIALLIFLLAFGIILGAFCQCHPFAFNWDPTIPGGHCSDQVYNYKTTGWLNVMLDLFVLLLPMPHLFKLELPRARKMILIITFALGLVTCIFSALRIQAIATIDFTDNTYLASVPIIYSILEPTLAITLACIPVLRPLLGGAYSKTGTRMAVRRGNRAAVSTKRTTTGRPSGLRSHDSTRTGRFQALDDEADYGYQLRSIEQRDNAQGLAARHRSEDGGSDVTGDETPSGHAGRIVVK
ncbi:unnamed protein product [Discula destructiva]